MKTPEQVFAMSTPCAAFLLKACVCLLSLASCCQGEEIDGLVKNETPASGQITVLAGMPSTPAHTRLAYAEGTVKETNGLLVTWKESGEKIYLLNRTRSSATVSTLTQSGALSANGKIATFSGELPADTQDKDKLCITYPTACTDIHRYLVSLSGAQAGALEELPTYMYGKADYRADEPLTLSFNYLTAVVKLQLKSSKASLALTDVSLSGTGICSQAHLDLSGSLPFYDYGNPDKISVHGTTPFAASEGVVTVYFSIIPGTVSGVEVSATDPDGAIYKATLGGIELLPGIMYTASIELAEQGKFACETDGSGCDGSAAKPYEIRSGADLKLLAERINSGAGSPYKDKYYVLTNDIDMIYEGLCSREGYPWTPIGAGPDTPFCGNFNGGGHTITNLCVYGSDNYQGLFGYVDARTAEVGLHNLTLKNATVSGNDYIGALVGKMDGGEGAVSNCHITGNIPWVKGNQYVGGLAGYCHVSSVIACSSALSVTSSANVSYCGGLIGYSSGGSIVACCATGGTKGNGIMGGLIGYSSESGIIAGCYATGDVEGTLKNVGGLLGVNDCGQVIGSYATGEVTGEENTSGCIIGQNIKGTVINCVSMKARIVSPKQIAFPNGGIGNDIEPDTNNYFAVGITAYGTIRDVYVAVSGAQSAWGTFSIHGDGTGTGVYTIENDTEGRTLDGAVGNQGIWDYGGNSSLRLWWSL